MGVCIYIPICVSRNFILDPDFDVTQNILCNNSKKKKTRFSGGSG